VSVEALPAERVEPDRRLWRNPFAVAFVLGAVVLTVFPLVQRLALRAPPPLLQLAPWSLQDLDAEGGRAFASSSLQGKVWIANFVAAPCDQECQESLVSFAAIGHHLDDLGDKVALVSFVRPQAQSSLAGIARPAGPAWHRLSGDAASFEAVWSSFARGWNQQTQALSNRTIEFLLRPTFAVVDQDGAVRGFWPADEAGRGHAINAVRMFAQHGTKP